MDLSSDACCTEHKFHTHTAVVCCLNWMWTMPTVNNYLPGIKEIQQNFFSAFFFIPGKGTRGDGRDFWESWLCYGSFLSLFLKWFSLLPTVCRVHTVGFMTAWFPKLWFSYCPRVPTVRFLLTLLS